MGRSMTVASHAFTESRRYNAAADFVDRNVAEGRGDKAAFIDPTRSLTYGELQRQSCRFACGLQVLGLRQESRILLLMLDTVDYPVAFWGAIRAGMVPIPLNTAIFSRIAGPMRSSSPRRSPKSSIPSSRKAAACAR